MNHKECKCYPKGSMKVITCKKCQSEWMEQMNDIDRRYPCEGHRIKPMMPDIHIPRLCKICIDEGYYVERYGWFPKFTICKM